MRKVLFVPCNKFDKITKNELEFYYYKSHLWNCGYIIQKCLDCGIERKVL